MLLVTWNNRITCKLLGLDSNTWILCESKWLLFNRNNHLSHIIMHKLLVLDRNTWNHITVGTLFVLDMKTWYHIIVYKQMIIDK